MLGSGRIRHWSMRMLSELNVNYRNAIAVSVLPGEAEGGAGLRIACVVWQYLEV